ncbi:MAG: ATP-dependent Clp protease adaptor ClpS [Bacteroidetes bacterium]|nr:ATP-dependent Clp protease adaptor ClpS [Bacteroidota bacterium]
MVKEKTEQRTKDKEAISEGKDIILFNDDVNSFDFVIETLIEVCEHDLLQAEQCTLIAHYKGKCAVKSGTLTELKPPSDEMTRRGLSVIIQ